MTQESKGRDQKGFENFPSPYWKKIFLSDFLIPGVVSCFSFEVKHPKHVHDAQFCTSASVLQLSLDKKVWYHTNIVIIRFPCLFGSYKCSIETKENGTTWKMPSHVERSLPYSLNKMGMSSMRNCEALFKWKKRRASVSGNAVNGFPE